MAMRVQPGCWRLVARAKGFAVFFAGVTLCGQALADGRISIPPVERYRLKNGLRVALAPDPSLDETSVTVHYDVGSADDPPGKEGLAHLVEHLMFDGSRHVGQGDYARWIARAGGVNVNGTTSLDGTNYVATVPATGLSVVFWLESDRMGFVADRLNPQIVQTEKGLIRDEMRDKILDRNLGIVGPAGWTQLFPQGHPYGRNQLYTGLADCTLDDVRAFLRTWYSPANAVVSVAGGFDVASVHALIERYFGDLPSVEPPRRPDLPSGSGVHDVRIDAGAGIPHDIVTFMWTAPAIGEPDDAALDLAAAILSDPEGRLQRDLVRTGLAVDVSARESSWRRLSVFWISAVLADGAASEDVVRAIDRAVGDMAVVVRQEEYERARDEWFDTLMLRLETPAYRAFRLAQPWPSESPWDLNKYDDFDPAELSGAVRSNLTPDNRVIVVVHHDNRYPGQGVVLHREARQR
jgi:zinc protease